MRTTQDTTSQEQPSCFLAVSSNSRNQPRLLDAICQGTKKAGYHLVTLDQMPASAASTIREAVIREIARADCIVADVGNGNPDVFFELGLARAMGKRLLLISQERYLGKIPSDILLKWTMMWNLSSTCTA